MSDSLTRLYLQRLDSFAQTLNYLYEIVGADEALGLLKDERLVQYKIDRVGELVRQVINSEKERIIIQLIHKIDIMERQLASKQTKKQETDQSQLIYYRKRLEQKNEEIQKIRKECGLLKQQSDQHKKISQQIKLQFEIYQNKYEEVKEKWQKFEQIRVSQAKNDKEKYSQLIQRVKFLQEQLQKEKTKCQQSMVGKANTVSMLKQEIEALTTKIHLNRQPSSKLKTQKIEWLKKEVKRLGNQLNQMKQMTRIILNYIRQSLSAQLKGIKDEISSINGYISSEFKRLLRDQSGLFKEYKDNIDKNNGLAKDQQLLKRMQGLQQQMNTFMETNMI